MLKFKLMCAAGKPQNSLGADNGWQQKIPSPSSGIRELRLGIRGYHKKDAYHWRRLQCQQQWTGQNQDSCQILYCADWCHPIPTVVRGSLCQAFGEEGWSEIGKGCCVVIELDSVCAFHAIARRLKWWLFFTIFRLMPVMYYKLCWYVWMASSIFTGWPRCI